MTRTRAISALVGAAAIGGLLFAATPASAAVAVLPEQDELYGIVDFIEDSSQFQLVGLGSTDATGTTIGAGNDIMNFDGLGQAAYDVSRDTSWVTYETYDGDVTTSFLATIDVTTGVATTVGEIVDGDGFNVFVLGVMVGDDGVIYALTDGPYALLKLDPTTAVATEVGPSDHFHSFAYNPVTDSFYGINHDDYDLYEIDVTTGAATFVLGDEDYFPEDTEDSHAMQFDSNGVLWFQTFDTDEENDLIVTYTLDSGVLGEIVGEPTVDGEGIRVDPSILITRGAAPVAPVEPTLAATGSDAGPVVLFGGLLLAAGAAVVLGRVASRRNAA